MALIKCPDCGKDISDRAEKCIQCGAPMQSVASIEYPEAREISGTEFEYGLIDQVYKDNMASRYRLLGVDGYYYLANDDVNVEGDRSSEIGAGVALHVGQIVSFRKHLNEMGRIEQIRITTDDYADIQFPPAKNILRTSNRIVDLTPSGELSASDSEKVTKSYLKYLVIVILIGGYWIAKGTPAPYLFFSGAAAERACIDLAERNRGSFLIGSEEIRADSSWVTGGKRVVRLLQDDGDNIRQVMCLYGNGMVEIPSAFEQARWR